MDVAVCMVSPSVVCFVSLALVRKGGKHVVWRYGRCCQAVRVGVFHHGRDRVAVGAAHTISGVSHLFKPLPVVVEEKIVVGALRRFQPARKRPTGPGLARMDGSAWGGLRR
jgi:hypothetical protein